MSDQRGGKGDGWQIITTQMATLTVEVATHFSILEKVSKRQKVYRKIQLNVTDKKLLTKTQYNL